MQEPTPESSPGKLPDKQPIAFSYDDPKRIEFWATILRGQGRWREAADLWLTAAGLNEDDPKAAERCRLIGMDCLAKAEESEPDYRELDVFLPKEKSISDLAVAALEAQLGFSLPPAPRAEEMTEQRKPAQSDAARTARRPEGLGDSNWLGQYVLLRKLGQGGMGAVYLAEDTLASRVVALKVLPRSRSENPEFMARFKREARALGKLNHPNVVAAFAVGEERGYHFYVMEYFEGEILSVTLERERLLPWRRALDVALQSARGLGHAHVHGIVHRDVKPANIYVTADSVAKILDLGLAVNILEATESFATCAGVALGTPHYMSPEQARGSGEIDGRSDVYSLGCTLYHLLTSRPPFEGPSIAVVLTRHLMDQVPNPRDLNAEIPDGLAHVVERMMAKLPGDRYPDCLALIEDLEAVQSGFLPKTQRLSASQSSVALPRPRASELLSLAKAPLEEDAPAGTGSPNDRVPANIADAERELDLIAGRLTHDGAMDRLPSFLAAIDDFARRHGTACLVSRVGNLRAIVQKLLMTRDAERGQVDRTDSRN